MARRKKRSSSNPAGGAGLAGLTVAELQREIAKRQRKAMTIVRKRDRLMRKVRALDAQIRAAGGVAGDGADGGRTRAPGGRGGRRGPRPKNERNLVESLALVLKGKTMGVTEVAAAVQKAGYKTNSDNFRTIVNQALITHKIFKRVSRGQYTAA